MIAVDSNIRVFAHRRDSPWYSAAFEQVRILAEGATPWALPWPCIYEYFGVVTHARIYTPPSSVAEALAQIDVWLDSPSCVLLSEASEYWTTLRRILAGGHIRGGQVHDAKIAALCVLHGVTELWSADRDFSRFPSLKTRNPLIGT